MWIVSLQPFIRQSLKAWEWGCRSAVLLLKLMEGSYGRRQMCRKALCSNLLYRLVPDETHRLKVVEPQSMVFVVDDDLSICRSIERLIEPAGFKVQSFRSSAQFFSQGTPSGPACLVLDVQLPVLSGLELQRELSNSGIQIPIVFITGHGNIPMTV